MRKLKVYLDTSVVSYLYQEGAQRRGKTHWLYGTLSGRGAMRYILLYSDK